MKVGDDKAQQRAEARPAGLRRPTKNLNFIPQAIGSGAAFKF